ncbi:unnamed protein product [Caenorhabditis angaria]|uniref:Zinc metalloproteinase n=1 Tax=Caenorhabditis angaria TaxID=860376 RepID=A0A9P1ICL7_9PELO|nr:unnamed protein product [Caenorhabditis angaria]
MNTVFVVSAFLFGFLVLNCSCDPVRIPFYRRTNHLAAANFNSQNSGIVRKVRQVHRDLSFRWPQNTIPFYITNNVTSSVKKAVGLAMKELQTKTCIRFQQMSSNYQAGDFVRIVDLGSCSSPIGRQEIGQQDISLTKNCWGMGTAIHELMHAIGIEHTQSRSDRNSYLDILYKNIDRSDLPNFELLSSRLWANLVPYDYGSVMHYSADSFANKDDEQTMLPKDRNFIETMGSMIPNFYDFDQINRYYQCYDSCSNIVNKANCANGGVPNPNNCQICICPLGYGGDLCDQRPSGCGSSLVASSQWQKQKISVKFDKKDAEYYTFCNYWIVAPTNSTIQVIYEISSDSVRRDICSFGCYEGGIEIKRLADPRITNDRDCCMDQALNITTKINPLPVIIYTSSRTVSYDISFRFLLYINEWNDKYFSYEVSDK